MFIKAIKIENYRRFQKNDNEVYFAVNKETNKQNKELNTTLIIGQNNAGKTSIISAIQKSCGIEKFSINDFNYQYLNIVFDMFKTNKDVDFTIKENEEIRRKILPYMLIKLIFSINCDEEESDELLSNIAPLIKNDLDENKEICCYIKYELKEIDIYINELKKLIISKQDFDLDDYLIFLNNNEFLFSTNIYIDDLCEEKIEYKISDLIKVKNIEFKKLYDKNRLTVAFNKILKYRIKKDEQLAKKYNDYMKNVNQFIDSQNFNANEAEKINKVISKVFDKNKIQMDLKADVTIDEMLSHMVKYVYREGDFNVPEEQFGMGYTNLMLIISEMIDYLDNVDENEFRNKINVLLIEEPESYMHPQMQQLLIRKINDMIAELINSRNFTAKVNCQIVLTSHSPYIINGKLEVENSFDYINYLCLYNKYESLIVPLFDRKICQLTKNVNKFEFLKKYIKYKCCELFFADACIIVEGASEELLLPYYLDKNEILNNKFISILNINGAYAHYYQSFLNMLKIPSLIFTDIDIKRADNGNVIRKLGSNDTNSQVTSLENAISTNSVINYYNINIEEKNNYEDENICIVFQNKINGFFPTSLEEAYILKNYKNVILNECLRKTVRNTYIKYYKINGYDSIKDNSYQFQKALSNKKVKFCSELLFNMINTNEVKKIPQLPNYIEDGLKWLEKKFS